MSAPQVVAVIPVFGRIELTHALLSDVALERPLVRPLIVDNGGDYIRAADEEVLPQARNLGWLRGTNVGVRHALATTDAEAIVLLNNDTRLSRGFFAGLLRASQGRRVGIVGPRYDDHFSHQRLDRSGPASSYLPGSRSRTVQFVDGTCLLARRSVLESVGLLDEEAFGSTGWGADIDLALRARRAGWRVVVTDRAFLSHATASTAKDAHGDAAEYWRRGNEDMTQGLERKWGPDWRWESGVAGRGPRTRVARLLSRARGRGV